MLGGGVLTMHKNKGIYRLFRTAAEFAAFKREIIHFTRFYTLDDVCIALGRMGFTEAQFEAFNKAYSEVANENAVELLEVAKDDKELWYSKDKKERELREYLGRLYVPPDERL